MVKRTDIREVREKKRNASSYYYHGSLWSPYRPTVVYLGSVAVGLSIVEMSEKVLLRYVGGKYVRDADYVPPPRLRHLDNSWTTTRDLPSGRLRLIAYSPYRRVNWSMDWQETSKTSLRSMVKSVEVAAVELIAKLEEADRKAEIARIEWEAAEERRQREEDRRRVKRSIQDAKEH